MRHTACRVSDVWLAQGWQITGGPDTPSRPCRALVGLAWLGPSGPVARGSNGIEQLRLGGGARATADTRSPATIPRNTTAGGFVCDAAFTTSGTATCGRSGARRPRQTRLPPRPYVADALVGGPLTRRKVHAFAKHPSGSRPGAPGARLPSDVVELDPAAPRPEGPACLRAQAADPGDRGAVTPRADGRQALPAIDQGPHGGPALSLIHI